MTFEDIRKNPLILTDAYNLSHYFLKKNVDWEISHLYNRTNPMILYGFNELVISTLNRKIEVDMVIEAEECAKKMNMPFPTDMWMRVVDELKGWIPLRVKGLPDGSYVPKGTPFAVITNTEEGFGEIVTWIEAPLLMNSFASGCATEAYRMRKYLDKYDLPKHRVHSFGFRGHNSLENAYWAATAWNLFLKGTDDYHSILHTPSAQMGSIPATAHKTIQQFDSEMEAYIFSIDSAKEAGYPIVALVIDTYDPTRFVKYYAKKLAEYAKKKGVTIIFRPDSGMVKEQAFHLYAIMESAGLLSNTGCIIGEGMTFDKVMEYDSYFKELGCDLKWFNYGVGAGYYKHVDRDFLGYAMKTAYSNGKDRMKFSANPIKQSIPGDVNLYVKNDKLTVGYGKLYKSLYKDIYYYDERSTRPKIWKQNWDDIKSRCDVLLLSDNSQGEVVLDDDVKEKIATFRNIYLEQEVENPYGEI